MGKILVNVLMLVALALPVALFLLLFSRLHLSGLLAAAIAISAGWALNVAWGYASDSQGTESYCSIALRFGWVCPAGLVLLTWVIWYFFFGRGA